MTRAVRVAEPAELLAVVGRELGPGDWLEVDQQRIDAFADATGDRQWIHVDQERAASGPFGGTIAHGYLTLSLLPRLCAGLVEVQNAALAINAGSDRVRFVQPVTTGSRVRASAVIAEATAVPAGVRVRLTVTVEIEHADRPALVADVLTVYAPAVDRP
jgi:acyl dehydratase